MRRAVSWAGFVLILALIVPTLPLSWAGAVLLTVVLFLFLPSSA